jgi:capsular polysaccharide biosynthesis protein
VGEVGSVVARLLRRYWVVIFTVILGLCGAFLYMQVEGPTYTSRAFVIVASTVESTGSREISYAQIFSRTISQPEVLVPAAADVGLDVEELKGRMKGNPATEAPSVELWATADSPGAAAQYANAVARSLIAYGNARTPDTSVRLALLGEAFPPATTSSPQLVNLAVGGSVGLLLGGFALMAGVGRPRSTPTRASTADEVDGDVRGDTSGDEYAAALPTASEDRPKPSEVDGSQSTPSMPNGNAPRVIDRRSR